MPQLMASTTTVRMAVARVELTPSMPTLARIEVRAANRAEPSANTNHINRPPFLLPKAKCGRPDGTGQPQLHGNVTDRACQDVELMPSPVQRLQQHAC